MVSRDAPAGRLWPRLKDGPMQSTAQPLPVATLTHAMCRCIAVANAQGNFSSVGDFLKRGPQDLNILAEALAKANLTNTLASFNGTVFMPTDQVGSRCERERSGSSRRFIRRVTACNVAARLRVRRRRTSVFGMHHKELRCPPSFGFCFARHLVPTLADCPPRRRSSPRWTL